MSNREQQRLEIVVAQLRHAYQQLRDEKGEWGLPARRSFAEGLLAPQIRAIEELLQPS